MDLCKDLYDTVEFYFRKDPDDASRRQKCERWGVAYASDPGEPAEPPNPPAPTPPALAGIKEPLVGSGTIEGVARHLGCTRSNTEAGKKRETIEAKCGHVAEWQTRWT